MVEVYHEERCLWERCIMRRDLCGRGIHHNKQYKDIPFKQNSAQESNFFLK